MKVFSSKRVSDPYSDKRESKIENPKWGRLVVIAVAFTLCGAEAQAQQPGKAAQIAYLDGGTAAGSAELLDDFRKRMTQFNWIDGKNLAIEYRYAEGKFDRLSALAADLVALRVDIILVSSTSTALAAKKATNTIPIVMVGVGDPVASGLIASLARPAANITGLSTFADELAGKRLEILKEVLPKSTRIGVIVGAAGARGAERQVKVMKEAAPLLGLKLVDLGFASDHEKLLNAFQAAVRERVNGIITNSGSVVFTQRKSIIVLAANHKLPAIYPEKEFVQDGGLLSYGVDRRDQYRRVAVYVDKISRGTKPADLPVERPMKFDFVINLKTAKQIGLAIPPDVLARADRVIR
jgi:putative tryptophan/tyrosine transport system substrate-binding protein